MDGWTAHAQKPLGDLLLGKGLISERELDLALTLQAEIGGLLGQVLVRIGAVSEGNLLQTLTEQLGLAVLAPEQAPSLEQAAAFIKSSGSPLAWWIDRQAIAWSADEAGSGPVICAALNPLDVGLRERILCLSDGAAEFRLAPRGVVLDILDQLSLGGRTPTANGLSDVARLRELAQEAPVVDFVNGVFADALMRRASDVHLEPFEDHFRVRLRIDGMLVTTRTGARTSFDAICSRIKLLSGMDIGERRRPQDGRQSIRVAGQELDLRVSTLPSAWGESLVLRLLGKSTRLPALDELGADPSQVEQLLSLVERPNGVVLLSGPTGSGKTTSIYRLLTHLNDGVRKIVTVEDPVEFDLPGVIQMQARSDIGLNFAAGLRSILRQDPDVIMVGEIRDPETARIAVQAALTGHLVISSVHTNSALAAIARLVDLGIETYLLADVIRGVVAQRLVRRLCQACARPSDQAQIDIYEAAAAGLSSRPQSTAAWREPVGCERCAGSGYLGRVGLFEVAVSSPELERGVRAQAGEDELRRIARRHGFRSLLEDGYRKARAGLTSMIEVQRVTGADAESDHARAEPLLAAHGADA
ncbi:MAG: ATPase, T2SS/T4P/T4SS family [Caulobacteraceae bacterium]